MASQCYLPPDTSEPGRALNQQLGEVKRVLYHQTFPRSANRKVLLKRHRICRQINTPSAWHAWYTSYMCYTNVERTAWPATRRTFGELLPDLRPGVLFHAADKYITLRHGHLRRRGTNQQPTAIQSYSCKNRQHHITTGVVLVREERVPRNQSTACWQILHWNITDVKSPPAHHYWHSHFRTCPPFRP